LIPSEGYLDPADAPSSPGSIPLHLMYGHKAVAAAAVRAQRHRVARKAVRPPAPRARGRPPTVAVRDEDVAAGPRLPLPPLAPIERRAFDYRDLELGMAQLDLVVHRTRRSLDALVRGAPAGTGSAPTQDGGDAAAVGR